MKLEVTIASQQIELEINPVFPTRVTYGENAVGISGTIGQYRIRALSK